jgi:DNA-binding CsgD family transcriptional regulator
MDTNAPSRFPSFFTEQQLLHVVNDRPKVETDIRRRSDAPRLLPMLLACETASQRESLVRGSLADAGFDWMAYCVMSGHGNLSAPKSSFTTYGNPGWNHRYFDERHYEVDFRHSEAPLSGLPVVWDVDDFKPSRRGRAPSLRERRFFEDLRDSGIGSGVFFQLPSATRPEERIVISLTSAAPDCSWIGERVLGRALSLGLCVHELLSHHMRTIDDGFDRSSRLSAFQIGIIECLRRGQSDKEIARALNMSTHAIDYHMRQLRRRFSARNRVQLVAAAAG